MNDLTIIFLTVNKLPEKWVKFQREHLLKAVGNYSIISVSKKPIDLGFNLIDTEPQCYWNIYMQMLRACLIAKTEYVAVAEDDVLYTKEHFNEFRPPLDSVSYDRSRWSLFAWDNIYCLRQRVSNCSLIAPRELLIKALTERKEKYPNGCDDKNVGEVGREIIEKRLSVTQVKSVDFYCTNPIIHLNHTNGTDKGDYGVIDGKRWIKKHGQIKAYDIPYWGKATDILKEFYG